MLTFRQYLAEVKDDDLLHRFARKHGVDLSLIVKGPKDWNVDWIGRDDPKNDATKGSGAKVMRAISKHADKKGATVDLTTMHRKLRRYYAQFGFEGAASNKFDHNVHMVRDPKKK